MNKPESVTLTLVNDRHNKSYAASLEEGTGGWLVNFSYGAIGAPQITGTKTKVPVPYAEAKKAFDRLVSEKTGKSCQCCGGVYTIRDAPPSDLKAVAQCARIPVIGQPTRATANAPAASVLSEGPGFNPELLEPIPLSAAGRYIHSPSYGMQRKYDGHRVAIAASADRIVAYNRTGKEIPVPARLAGEVRRLMDAHSATIEALMKGKSVALMLDGEYLHDEYVAFHLLTWETDIKHLPFLKRWDMLAHLLEKSFTIRLAELFTTHQQKAGAYLQEEQQHGEGVVFKRLDAPYMPGRGGVNVKCKFWRSATVRIATKQKTTTHHSFGTEVLKNGKWVYTGSVTCKGPLPELGTFRELKYLYLGPGGHFVQPEDLGERTDVTEEDCGWSSLKIRQPKELMLV